MNRKFFVLSFLIITLSCSFFLLKQAHSDKNSSDNTKVHFSDILMDEDKLVEDATLIVKGHIGKIKEKKNKWVNFSDDAKIQMSYVICEFNVEESLKGDAKNKIDLIFVLNKEKEFVIGDEYIFFLEPNILEKDSYSLLSYTQSFFELDTQSDMYKNNFTQLKISDRQIKDKVLKNIN